MSKISLIYDAWIDLIEDTLPTYARIANGLDAGAAPSILLRKGYAFIPATGENTERQICGKRSYSRSFDIILINQVTATENNIDSWDGIIKSIHEDVTSLFKATEESSTLNDIANGLGNSRLVSDSGIEYVANDDINRYFQIILTVETEYFEALT